MVELIAHRAGNTVAGIESFPSGVDGIELDVHLHRDQLVVRHAKRLWLTSRLWDRWYLLPVETEVPRLEYLVEHIDDEVGLWIDCKGVTSRLPLAVLGVVGGDRMITLSTKSWWIFRELPPQHNLRTFRSVGNRFEMLLLWILPPLAAVDGIVIHSRLLSPRVVTLLRRRHGLVFSWAIGDEGTGRRLLDWGVNGLIVDDPQILEALAL